MAIRDTQEYLDIWAFPDSMKARVTQEYLDSWVVPDSAKARITQEYLDVWVVTSVGPGARSFVPAVVG